MRGPYGSVRHPIYTHLLAMFVATWMEHSHITGMIGLVLTVISI